MVPNCAPLLPNSSPSMRTESPLLRKRACRSGTRRRKMKFCSATVATVSPGRMTVPVVTGTFSTRPAGRRQHVAFGDLLLDHRALGGARLQRVGCDVERCARLVERRLRHGALAREQIFGAGEIGLRLRDLGFERGNLRVERLHLQRELLVADGGDHLPLLDRIAFLDGERHHGAADARPRRHHVGAFHRGEHRLFVGHLFRRDDESLLRKRRCANSASMAATTIPARISMSPQLTLALRRSFGTQAEGAQ